MIAPKCTTNITLKEAQIDTFCKLIKDQIVYGGKKYARTEAKESTDVIVESFGIEWVLGTCMKYIFRFHNTQREKDLLKVAAYMFIVWLQMGFHLQENHETDTWNDKKP